MTPTHHPLAAEPRPFDPETTRIAVTIINPSHGGAFCIDGKDVLPVGAEVWTDPDDPNRKPDAEWRVMFFEDQDTPIQEVDHRDWRPETDDLSEQGVTRVDLRVMVRGVNYPCSRIVTVVESVPDLG